MCQFAFVSRIPTLRGVYCSNFSGPSHRPSASKLRGIVIFHLVDPTSLNFLDFRHQRLSKKHSDCSPGWKILTAKKVWCLVYPRVRKRHMNIWVTSELDWLSSSGSALQSFLLWMSIQDFPLHRVGNLCYSCMGHQKIFSLQFTPFYSYKYPTALPQLLPCCSYSCYILSNHL